MTEPRRSTAPIDFYFDFSSPYGYFAAEKIDALAERFGRTVLWHPFLLGVTFKENCPDIRNSHVVDVIQELKEFGCEVVVHDPWADPEDVRHEYGLEMLPALEPAGTPYDAVVLAVAHEKFRALDFARFKKDNTVIFDIKSFLARGQVDGRL